MVTVRLQSFTPNRSLDLAVAQEHNLVAVALMDSATPIMLPSRATSVTSAATRYGSAASASLFCGLPSPKETYRIMAFRKYQCQT